MNRGKDRIMRFLMLFFLADIALASAGPLPNHNVVEHSRFLEDLFLKFFSNLEDNLKYHLRVRQKHLTQLLNNTKDAIHYGKLNETRLRSKDLKIDNRNGRKELIEKVKEKVKDYWNKIWSRITHQISTLPAEDGKLKYHLGVRQKHLTQLLNNTKDAIHYGKVFHENKKLNETQLRSKDLKIDNRNGRKELIEKVKEKVKDYWNKIWGRITHQISTLPAEKDDIHVGLVEKMNEAFLDILKKIKDAFDNGKTIKEDTLLKIKNMREKLRDLEVDVGKEKKELIAQLRKKAKDNWQKILDRLDGNDKRERI